MRALIHIAPFRGHVEASLPLASQLAARGHEVVYSTSAAHRATIEARGFRCVVMHRVWTLDRDPDTFQELQAIADDYLRGAVDEHVRALGPSIVIADARAVSPLQLVARALGIPCVQLSFSPEAQPASPPTTTSLPPTAPASRLAAARWEASCLHPSNAPLGSAMLVSAMAARYAHRFDYPSDGVSFATAFGPTFTTFPQLVASAAAIDFPVGAASSHAALPVDVELAEPVAPTLAAAVADAKGLVVVWFGERPARYPHARRLVSSLCDAARRCPERRFVVIGGDLEPPTSAPANLAWTATAPRPWLLRRASVLICDGDLLDVRQAIATSVPVIAVAQEGEQHGIAARIVHLGIGTSLVSYAISGPALVDAIAVVSRADVAQRLAEVSASCRREEAELRAVALIEASARDDAREPIAIVDARHRDGWIMTDAVPGDCRASPHETIGDALGAATGTVLVRVADEQRSWSVDLTPVLRDFAWWCADVALEPAASYWPERVMLARGLLAEHRIAFHDAASHRMRLASRRLHELAFKLWHHGFAAAALATADSPLEAARASRFEALAFLATQGQRARSDEHDYAEVARRVATELQLHVDRARDPHEHRVD